MSANELAAQLGINSGTLRFWLRQNWPREAETGQKWVLTAEQIRLARRHFGESRGRRPRSDGFPRRNSRARLPCIRIELMPQLQPHPAFKFSGWALWENRAEIDGAELPGVYAMAHFDKPASGEADPIGRETVYIGETCENTLLGRWSQFRSAVIHGKRRHSGGLTYRKTFGELRPNLYVAAMSVDGKDDTQRSFFIRYAERRLLLEYAQKWGQSPDCNSK